MLEDVRLAVKGRVPVEFYGRLGGVVPFPDEILNGEMMQNENLLLTGNQGSGDTVYFCMLMVKSG